ARLDKPGGESGSGRGRRGEDKEPQAGAGEVPSGGREQGVRPRANGGGQGGDGAGGGLSGKDAGLLTVEKTKRTKRDPDSMIEHEVDLGFVGEPTKVDPKLIKGLIASETEDWVPVIAPIGVAEDGLTYNVNADTVAGAVAGALHAKRMLLLTDVPGVKGADGEIIRQMTLEEAQG